MKMLLILLPLFFDYECLPDVSLELHGTLPKSCALTVKIGGGLNKACWALGD